MILNLVKFTCSFRKVRNSEFRNNRTSEVQTSMFHSFHTHLCNIYCGARILGAGLYILHPLGCIWVLLYQIRVAYWTLIVQRHVQSYVIMIVMLNSKKVYIRPNNIMQKLMGSYQRHGFFYKLMGSSGQKNNILSRCYRDIMATIFY